MQALLTRALNASLFLIASLVLIGPRSSFADTEGNTMSREWFRNSSYKSISIKHATHASDQAIAKELDITDPATIQSIVNRIKQIPADGDMMKSFSDDAPYTLLEFTPSSGETDRVEIINGRINTPSTGFNAPPPQIEKDLSTDISNLLAPRLDTKIMKVPGLALSFGDMTVTYIGTTMRPQQPGEPTIGGFETQAFEVKDKTGAAQNVTVTSSQDPPEPVTITIGGDEYTLFTHQDKAGVDLYPAYFKVIKGR